MAQLLGRLASNRTTFYSRVGNGKNFLRQALIIILGAGTGFFWRMADAPSFRTRRTVILVHTSTVFTILNALQLTTLQAADFGQANTQVDVIDLLTRMARLLRSRDGCGFRNHAQLVCCWRALFWFSVYRCLWAWNGLEVLIVLTLTVSWLRQAQLEHVVWELYRGQKFRSSIRSLMGQVRRNFTIR